MLLGMIRVRFRDRVRVTGRADAVNEHSLQTTNILPTNYSCTEYSPLFSPAGIHPQECIVRGGWALRSPRYEVVRGAMVFSTLLDVIWRFDLRE